MNPMFRAIPLVLAAVFAFAACSGKGAQVVIIATPTDSPPPAATATPTIAAAPTAIPSPTTRPTPTIDSAALQREANFQTTYAAIILAVDAIKAVWSDEADMYLGGFNGTSKAVETAYNHMQSVSCQSPNITQSGAVLYGPAGDLWPAAYKVALDKAQFGCYVLQQYTNDRTTDRWAATSYALTQNVTELRAALGVIQANSNAQLQRAIRERQ